MPLASPTPTEPTAPPRRPFNWAGVGMVALGGLAAAWTLSQLGRPLAQDQGIFASVGDVIAGGGIPYRDAWEIKGPGLLYTWALIQQLFRGADWGLRLADVVFLGAGLFWVGRFTERLSPPATIPAMIVLFAWYAGLDFYDTAQPDGWVGMLLALAALLITPTGGRVTRTASLFHGVILGWCALFKPVYALLGLMALGRALADMKREPGPALRNLGLVVLGAMVPIGAMAAWFWSHGALHDAIEANILYTATAYRPGGALLKAWAFMSALLKSPGIALAALLALPGTWAALRLDRGAGMVLGGWLIGTAGCVALQAKYWGYHWTPFLYPLAIAATLGAVWLGGVVSRRAGSPGTARLVRSALPALILIPACIGSVVRSVEAIGRWAGSRLMPQTRQVYECAEFTYYGDCEASLGTMARHIVQHTGPSDRILMWGNKSLIYHLSHRRQASRFGWNWALVRLPGNPYREKYRAELLDTVRQSPPAYIVARIPEACDGTPASELECLDSFPELAALAAERYQLETTVGNYGLYRLRPATSP